jgi:hypothetical protein
MRRQVAFFSVLMILATFIACDNSTSGGTVGFVPTIKLTSLAVEDSSQTGIKLTPDFDPNVINYSVNGIHEDIVGVKVIAAADPGVKIVITSEIETDFHENGSTAASRTPGSGGAGTWPYGQDWPNVYFPDGTASIRTFRNPSAIGSGPTGTWNDNGSFRGPHSTKAFINVSKDGESTTYTITLNVLDGTPSYNLFKVYAYGGTNNGNGDLYQYAGSAYTSTIDDGLGGPKVKINYLLYIPKNIGLTEKLPVIYSPHGGTQQQQPPDMTLKRYQLATIWAKNSEARADRRAIVIVPHTTNWDFSDVPATRDFNAPTTTGYASGYNTGSNLSLQGKASFELLTKLVAGTLPGTESLVGHIDLKRIYVQGFSMGGACAVASLSDHPNYFAAALIGAPAAVFTNITAAAVVAGGTPIYSLHAKDDPVVDFHNSEINNTLLSTANASYTPVLHTDATTSSKLVYQYYEPGTYFYETAHFAAQVPLYWDESFFDWFFAQQRASDAVE